MAQSLLSLADDFPDIELLALVSRKTGREGDFESAIPRFTSLDQAHASLGSLPDLVIDFSLAEGTPVVAKWCGDHGVPLLSGVTGIDSDGHRLLDEASASAPVLWAPNLSPGINLLSGLLRQAASFLGAGSGITIEEAHHEGKKDAPSGTALHLADQFETTEEIDFISHREGEVVGVHEVRVAFADETLVFRHEAHQRRLFARGALQAGEWLVAQAPGRYSAADWISGVIDGRKSGVVGQA